jgi:hypothetical protein
MAGKMKRVFTTTDGRLRLAVGDDGKWIVEIDDKVVDLEHRAQFRALLPLLEEEPRRTLDTLNAAMEEHHLAAPPTEELILHSLEYASSYWKELALHWLETAGSWNDEIREHLESIAARDSEWPQPLRHRAKRLLRSHAR